MKVKIFTTLDEQFKQEWFALWQHAWEANYTNAPQWFLSVLGAFSYKEYVIIAVYKNEALVAVAGFIKDKKYGVDFYTIPPASFIYGSPFLLNWQDRDVLTVLLREVAKIGNVFMENIPQQFTTQVQAVLPTTIPVFAGMNYYFDFEKDKNGQVKIPHRNKLLRKVKDNEDLLTIKSFTGFHEKALETVFTIDAHSRKQARGYNTFSDLLIQQFYIKLAKQFGNVFRVFILYFDTIPIAYRIGFVIGKTYYGSQTAFRSDYEQYWPGSVSLVLITDYLATLGVTRIDFGCGDSYSKRSLSNGSRVVQNYIISKNIFIRTYVQLLYLLRNSVYSTITKNIKVYAFYRGTKKQFQKLSFI